MSKARAARVARDIGFNGLVTVDERRVETLDVGTLPREGPLKNTSASTARAIWIAIWPTPPAPHQ